MPNLFEQDSIVTYWANIAARVTVDAAAYGAPKAQTDRQNVKVFEYQGDVANAAHYMAANVANNENILGSTPSPYVRIPGGYTP